MAKYTYGIEMEHSGITSHQKQSNSRKWCAKDNIIPAANDKQLMPEKKKSKNWTIRSDTKSVEIVTHYDTNITTVADWCSDGIQILRKWCAALLPYYYKVKKIQQRNFIGNAPNQPTRIPRTGYPVGIPSLQNPPAEKEKYAIWPNDTEYNPQNKIAENTDNERWIGYNDMYKGKVQLTVGVPEGSLGPFIINLLKKQTYAGVPVNKDNQKTTTLHWIPLGTLDAFHEKMTGILEEYHSKEKKRIKRFTKPSTDCQGVVVLCFLYIACAQQSPAKKGHYYKSLFPMLPRSALSAMWDRAFKKKKAAASAINELHELLKIWGEHMVIDKNDKRLRFLNEKAIKDGFIMGGLPSDYKNNYCSVGDVINSITDKNERFHKELNNKTIALVDHICCSKHVGATYNSTYTLMGDGGAPLGVYPLPKDYAGLFEFRSLTSNFYFHENGDLFSTSLKSLMKRVTGDP